MDYSTDITDAAKSQNIPVDLFKNAINANSGGDAFFTGGDGSFGLGGVQPQTLIELGFNPYEPKSNAQGSAVYFRKLFDQFGNWKDATQAFVSDDDKGAQVFQNSSVGEITNEPKSVFGMAKSVVDTLIASPEARQSLHGAITQNPFANNPALARRGVFTIAGYIMIGALIWFGANKAMGKALT